MFLVFNTCKQPCKVCMALDLTLTGRELQSSKVRNAANLVLTERSTPHPSLPVTPDQPQSHPDLYPHRRKSLLLHTLMTFNFFSRHLIFPIVKEESRRPFPPPQFPAEAHQRRDRTVCQEHPVVGILAVSPNNQVKHLSRVVSQFWGEHGQDMTKHFQS